MGTIVVLGLLGLAFAAAAIFGHWLTQEEAPDGGPISARGYSTLGDDDAGGDAGDL